MKAPLFGLFFTVAILAPLSCDAYPRRESMGPLYHYIATKAFADGAREFYLKSIALNDERAKVIAQVKEECGGRYEGTSVQLVELTHIFDTDRRDPIGNAKNYKVPYITKASVHWLVVETISCSTHRGHNQSVLRATLLTGDETQVVTYPFKNKKQVGSPVVSDLRRSYKFDTNELSDHYRSPYLEK
jgi:hypothetical protein